MEENNKNIVRLFTWSLHSHRGLVDDSAQARQAVIWCFDELSWLLHEGDLKNYSRETWMLTLCCNFEVQILWWWKDDYDPTRQTIWTQPLSTREAETLMPRVRDPNKGWGTKTRLVEDYNYQTLEMRRRKKSQYLNYLRMFLLLQGQCWLDLLVVWLL